MITVTIQPNPFKQEKFVRQYDYCCQTVEQLYLIQNIDVAIASCVVFVNDISITDYSRVVDDEDIIVIKALPEGEDGTGAAAGAVGGGMAALIWLAVAGGTLLTAGLAPLVVAGVGALIGGLIGWGISAAIPDKAIQEYSLSAKENSNEQNKIVPVLYGSSKFTPSFGGNDYTTKVDSSVIVDEKAVQDTYLHQLYVLGYHPTVIDNIKIDDNVLAETTTISASVAFDSSGTMTAVGSFVTASKMYDNAYISVVGSVENDRQYTVDSFTDDVLTVTPIDGASMTTEGAVAVVISFLIVDGANCVYSDVNVQLVTDGVLGTAINPTKTNYPFQTKQTSINKVCRYQTYQYYTTPDNVASVDLDMGFLSGIGRLKSSSNDKLFKAMVRYHIWVKLAGEDDTMWRKIVDNQKYKGATTEPYTFTQTLDLAGFVGVVRGQFNIRIEKHKVKSQYIDWIGTKTWKELTTDSDDMTAGLVLDTLTLISAKTNKVDSDGTKISPVDTTTGADLLLLVLKIRASDQLSGSINTLTVEGNRWISDYDSATSAWIVRETSNPASIFVDVLTNTKLAQHPTTYSDTYFDTTSIETWHDWCEAGGEATYGDTTRDFQYMCNGVLFDSTTVADELTKIANTGQSTYGIVDGKYQIQQLVAKPTPVQMFTARNIVKDSYSATRTFNDIPDNVQVTFVNADTGHMIEVIDTNDSPTTTQSINYQYVTDYGQAYALAKFVENSFQNQVIGHHFTTGMDALVATKGDRVLLQHDATLTALSSGRITALESDASGLLISITVDEQVLMTTGTDYGITIRTPSNLLDYNVVTDDGYQYTMVIKDSSTYSSYTPHGIAVGDLFSYGLTGSATEDLIITDIQYDSRMQASITCAEYVASIYDIDSITQWTPSTTKASSDQSRSLAVLNDVHANVDDVLNKLIAVQNTPDKQIFQSRPSPPYSLGDVWLQGAGMYDCVVDKIDSEVFAQSDWRARATNTFEVLNKDSFNEPTPSHRWQLVPGDALPYNLLTNSAFSVTEGDGTKENILIDATPATTWAGTTELNAVTVVATGASNIVTKGNFTSATVVGRYELSGYMGEEHINLIVSPNEPATQDVSLTDTEVYVLQVYRGSAVCSYGTATEGNPLSFTATATAAVTFTMTDCRFCSLTNSAYIPPYVNGTFSAHSDNSITLTGTTLTVTTKLINIPSDAISYGGILSAYGDASNYINVYMANNEIYIDIMSSGNQITDTIATAVTGTVIFELDWTTGVIISTNYAPRDFQEYGSTYGFSSTENYGFSADDAYGYDDGNIVFGTPLTSLILGLVNGQYLNGTVIEVEENA